MVLFHDVKENNLGITINIGHFDYNAKLKIIIFNKKIDNETNNFLFLAIGNRI